MRFFLPPSALLIFGGLVFAGSIPVEHSDAAGTDVGTRIVRNVSGVVGYARWPQSSSADRLCVAGGSAYLQDVQNSLSQVGERSWSTRAISMADTDSIKNCDLLYLGNIDTKHRKIILLETIGRPVLTITEGDAECNEYSMFCLVIRDQEVGLIANLDAIARSGIRVNPKVLQLIGRRQSPQ